MLLSPSFMSFFLRRVVCVTVGVVLCTSACAPNPKDRKRVTAQSVLESHGQSTKDMDGVEGVLAESAREALARGDLQRAGGLFEQLYDRYPDNNEYLFGYATILRRKNLTQPAIKAYAELLKREPENLDYLEGSALALITSGDFDKALKYLNHVQGKDATRWQTLNGIGVVLSMQNNHPQALQYYQSALKYKSNYPPILNNTGLTFAIMGNYDKALRAFELAQQQLIGSDETITKKQVDMNLALIYALMGQMDKAEATAKPHLSKAELYNNMGLFAYLSRDPKLAETYLNMALKDSKTYYETAWRNLEKVKREMQEQGTDRPNGLQAPQELQTLQ